MKRFKTLQKYLILVIIASFVLISWMNSAELRIVLTQDLSKFAYNNDQGAFLKTYHLMEQGTNYYMSFKKSMTGKFSHPPLPQDIWSWRMPTIFVLWKFLPGKSGVPIYILFLFLCSSVIYLAYLIGKRYLPYPFSILPAYSIVPYLNFGSRSEMFLLTEWWAVFIFIIGIYLLISKKLFFSIIFLSFSILIREILILPILLLLIFSFFKKRNLVPVFLIPLFSFCILFLFHLLAASNYIDSFGTIFNLRTVNNGLFFVQQTLAYGSGDYLFFFLRLFLFYLLASIVGIYFIFKKKNVEEASIWAVSFIIFPFAFLKFGNTPYNDYWGIFYMPFVLIFAPLSLGLLIRNKHFL